MSKRFVVHYGAGLRNSFESNSRNARQHLIDLGGDEVLITNHSGKRICGASRSCDDDTVVYAYSFRD